MPKKLRTLRQVRMALGMTQRELAIATGKLFDKGVHYNTIYTIENGTSTTELTATKILMTINHLHTLRGRPLLTLDDLDWTISDRKPEEGEKQP